MAGKAEYRRPSRAEEYVALRDVLQRGDSLLAVCLTLKDERLLHEKEAKAALTRLIVQRAGELAQLLHEKFPHVPR